MKRTSRRVATIIAVGCLAASGCYSGLGVPRDAGEDGGDADGTDGDGAADGADDGADDAPQADDDSPGRVTLHRLNRAEYNNTIRDLLFDLDVSPADVFPADDHSLGFDNIADVLSVTPTLFELYERAAEQSLEAALAIDIAGELIHTEAEAAGGTSGGECCGGFWNLSSTGTITANVQLQADADYRINVRAYEQAAGPESANMRLLVDGVQVTDFAVTATSDAPAEYEVEAALTAGAHTVTVEFTNDFFDAEAGEDRNLYVDWIDVEGLATVGPDSVRNKLLLCDPEVDGEDACARQVLETFVPRAWRRPTTPAEIESLLALAAGVQADAGSWEDGIRVALKAALVSPHFIFRVEIDPEPDTLTPHPLGDYEVASRLSYLMWSSMPDADLFARAAAGELSDPAVLRSEVARMLADDRASALVANFFGQWLWVRALSDPLSKDYELFPLFNTDLQASMVTETNLFLQTFVREDRSMQDLLVAEETFIDAPLAELYGLPAPATSEVDENGFARVAFDGAPRRGLLTQGGLMSVLSHPNVTSPVRRGKWVLEQLLCMPPPAPPPGVEVPPVEPSEGGTMREQLEQHRADPACAACHNLMDPLGLALEHYSAIGAYRELDAGMAIDVAGVLPDGTAFDGALEMSTLIADHDDFARCTVRKAMTYALGRDVAVADVPYIDEIMDDFYADGMTLEALLAAVVTNDTFTMRHGEAE